MGTHVPFVAYWKGQTPKGKALDDLVDFTDFYATLAEAAGATRGDRDPIDGRSFLPQLKGRRGIRAIGFSLTISPTGTKYLPSLPEPNGLNSTGMVDSMRCRKT